jgi:hypothetical protein
MINSTWKINIGLIQTLKSVVGAVRRAVKPAIWCGIPPKLEESFSAKIVLITYNKIFPVLKLLKKLLFF